MALTNDDLQAIAQLIQPLKDAMRSPDIRPQIQDGGSRKRSFRAQVEDSLNYRMGIKSKVTARDALRHLPIRRKALIEMLRICFAPMELLSGRSPYRVTARFFTLFKALILPFCCHLPGCILLPAHCRLRGRTVLRYMCPGFHNHNAQNHCSQSPLLYKTRRSQT